MMYIVCFIIGGSIGFFTAAILAAGGAEDKRCGLK